VITGNKIRYLFLLLLIIAGEAAFSQDLATAKKLWEEKRMMASKEAIDGYLEEAGAEDAEGWLLKAAIYSAISTDPQLKYLVADGRMDAFSAIKKAAALNQKWVTEQLTASKFELLQVIYKGCTSDGVAFFNAGALDFFKKAVSVSDFVLLQGWKTVFQPNDTVLLYNITQSAINAQREDDAVLYGRKLAGKGIYSAGMYSKADFENIYQWLVNYYHIKKDGPNLQLYAAKGAKIYPKSLYFTTISINNYRETGNYKQMVQAYEAAVKRFPQNHSLRYIFCNDLFNYIYSVSVTETIPIRLKKLLYVTLTWHLQTYILQEPDSASAILLLGKHYYNKSVDLLKAGFGNRLITQILGQAIRQLKLYEAKATITNDIHYKEGVQLLVNTLYAVGDKAEAERYSKLLQGI
jgi:hypothetical protein